MSEQTPVKLSGIVNGIGSSASKVLIVLLHLNINYYIIINKSSLL